MSLQSYLGALALTLFVELAVASLFSGNLRRKRTLATCALSNLVTHPLAMLLALRIEATLSLELGVILAELACYLGIARQTRGRAVAIAVIGNGLTAFIGLIYWG